MNQNTGATTVEDECSRSHLYTNILSSQKSLLIYMPMGSELRFDSAGATKFQCHSFTWGPGECGQFLNCFTGISAVMEKMRLQPSPPAVRGAESISVIPTQMKCNSLHHGYCPPFLQQAQNPTANQTPGHVEAQRGKKVRAIWHDWMLFYYRFFSGLCSWVSLTSNIKMLQCG